MFAAGLVDETRVLLAPRPARDGRTASRALGYQQVVAALDGGQLPAAAAAEHGPGDPAVRPPAARPGSAVTRASTGWTAAHPDVLAEPGAALPVLTPRRR